MTLRWSGSNEAMRQYQEACAKLPPPAGKKGKRLKKKNCQRTPPTKMPFVPYGEYLLSKWWKQKRAQKLKSVGSQCEKCHAKKSLHVHHLNYDRLGRERHSDLQVLCKRCHEYEHQGTIAANEHLDSIARSI